MCRIMLSLGVQRIWVQWKIYIYTLTDIFKENLLMILEHQK